MTVRRARLRGVALLPAGAFAVHQLRLLLEFGGGNGGERAAHGHLYIGSLLPWLMMALAAGLGGLLIHVAGDWRRARRAELQRAPSLRALWLAASLALVGLHVLQEGIEGLVMGGSGLAGLVSLGGLWALAVALAVGALIALALRGARALVVRAGRARRPLAAHGAPAQQARRYRAARPRISPLARRAAGRAPPARLRPAG